MTNTKTHAPLTIAICLLALSGGPGATAAAAACLSPPSGLAAWWPGDGYANDLVGTNQGAFYNGASAGATGLIGQAFGLDGIGDRVSLPESPVTDLSRMTRFTLEAWINPASFVNQGYPTIYAEGFWGVSLGLHNPTGTLESWINGANPITSASAVQLSQWSHVALVCDGTNRIFYLNGAPAGSGSAPAINPDNNGAAIGGVAPDDGRARFSGLIDEVSIYNRALSSNEIAAIYVAGSAGKCKPIVPPPDLPDLVVSPPSWTGVGEPGYSLTVSWGVTNLGAGPATGNWHDQLVVSTNSTLAGAVGAYDSVRSAAVPTNGGYLASQTVTFPAGTRTNYYLIAVVDSLNWALESNESNNAQASPITLVFPDLAPVSVSCTPPPVSGQPLTLTMVVTNIGAGPAGGTWHDQWVLSTNLSVSGAIGVFGPDCNAIWQPCNHPVPANGSYTLNLQVTLPNVPAGPYYLIAVVNDAHALLEGDYANNTSPPVPITVGIPDLAPVNVSWTGQPVAGQSLTLNMAVTNIGSGLASGAWHDQWVLSTNLSVSGAVGVFGPDCGAGWQPCNHPAPANGGYTLSLQVTLPNVPASPYYLIAGVNDAHATFEGNYANNTSAPVAITLSIPDLACVDVSWSGKPVAGQSLMLNMVVTNVGSGRAGGGWHDQWVLSTNLSVTGAVAVFGPDCGAGWQPCNHPAPANGGYTLSLLVTLPNVPANQYYLIGVANDTHATFESDYANNASAPLAITIGNADLIATNFTIAGPAIAGTDLAVSFTVVNAGTNAYSSFWHDRVTLSTNSTPAGGIANWDFFGYHSLPIGGSYVQDQSVLLPRVAAGTNYYLIARADAGDEVSESNETNNLQVLPVTMTNRPPTIALLSPAGGIHRTSCVPVLFPVSAGVHITSYLVTNVEFYDGAASIGHSTDVPQAAVLSPLDHGSHLLTARATDSFGLLATSLVATVTVDWPDKTNLLRGDLAPNRDCVFCMAAFNGSNYVVETTTNLRPLIPWQPYLTNQVANSLLVFTNHPAEPRRFFRARTE